MYIIEFFATILNLTVLHLLQMDHAYFQWKVRKYEIQDKSMTELNPGNVPEIKDWKI